VSQTQQIAVAVIVHAERVVVAVRADDPGYGGVLEFPGGKVRDGETVQAAAEREAWEEAAVRVRAGTVLHMAQRLRAGKRLQLTFLACEPLSDWPPLPPFFWYPCSALDPLDFPEVNRPLVERLRREPCIR